MVRLSILLACCIATAPVSAQLTDPAVVHARASLAQYDFFGSETLDVIRALGEFVVRAQRDAELDGVEDTAQLREARFLRAMAAADMTLISHFHHEPAFVERVAQAYGAPVDALVHRLRDDLARVDVGVYAATAHDARLALRLLDGEAPDWSFPGDRRDALFVTAARHAATSADPIHALATLASDPCAQECSATYAHFDETGRRAIHAVEEVFAVLSRLVDHDRHGDPFSHALAVDSTVDRIAFEGLELTPRLMLENLGLTPARADELTVTPDAVVVVHRDEIRIGFVPRVGFPGGVATAVGAGQPLLPATDAVAIPSGLRAFPTAISDVTSALRERLADARTVALGGSDDVEAHLLTRVWMSADAAGHTPSALVGVGPDGSLRGVPARAVHGADASSVQVFVRLGGHTVSRRGTQPATIPRLRTDDGFRFDWTGVSEQVTSDDSTSVRFMGTLAYSALARTAFLVAPRSEPLTLVLP